MSIDPWLVWLIIGVICVIIEILDPAVFFISFGIGGLVTSVISTLEPPIWIQILIFGVVSFVVFLFMRKLYEKLIDKNAKDTNVYALVGKVGIVQQDIPADGRGYVKIDGEEWSAVSDNSEIVAKGQKVEIVSIEGNKVIVKAK